MLSRDRQRLNDRARMIMRRQLATFLAWVVQHACVRTNLKGQRLTLLTLTEANTAMQDELYTVADAGAFRYFGISSGYELGTVPVMIAPLPAALGGGDNGLVALANVNQVIDYIAGGGLRGAGWVAPGELTLDDLAR